MKGPLRFAVLVFVVAGLAKAALFTGLIWAGSIKAAQWQNYDPWSKDLAFYVVSLTPMGFGPNTYHDILLVAVMSVVFGFEVLIVALILRYVIKTRRARWRKA